MPKKRVKAKERKPGGKLPDVKLCSLLGGVTMKALLAKKEGFQTDGERREAWLANREQLFYRQLDKQGGLRERAAYTRAPAWWDYEAPEPRQEGETEKEYLIRVNLVTAWDRKRELEPLRDYTEKEQLVKVQEFIGILELKKQEMKARYIDYKENNHIYHNNKTWPELVKEYGGQAVYLAKYAAGGQTAAEAWQEVMEEVVLALDVKNREKAKEEAEEEARQAWEKKKKDKTIKRKG